MLQHPFSISRRNLLGGAGAGFAIAGAGIRPARAEVVKHIERFDPALDTIIDINQPIQILASGLGGPKGPAEGPVWFKEGGYLLFNDITADKRLKYVPGRGVTVDQVGTGHANGQTRDRQGRLVTCDYDARQVSRHEFDGSSTVIANNFQSKRLTRPNDVVVKSDGATYFTDPVHSNVPMPWDTNVASVYRVPQDLSTVSLLIDNFVTPNGIAFSPDEKTLYINDWRRKHIRAFELLPTGMLLKSSDRVFADLAGSEPGEPDGMKVDIAGNVYCGGSGGLYILDRNGKKLGRIVHGQTETTNIGFGGDDWKSLYFTTRTTLNVVTLKMPGLPVPSRKA